MRVTDLFGMACICCGGCTIVCAKRVTDLFGRACICSGG